MVVEGVGARRVAAVVVRAGAVTMAMAAGGVEAAEQEGRQGRGHRHGRLSGAATYTDFRAEEEHATSLGKLLATLSAGSPQP